MNGRVKNSVNNIIFGIIEQIVTIVLMFINRTVFIQVLNENLLGVNGLFSNILSILSIAELGFGSAIIYGMYKPLLQKDYKKIAAFMNYYKKIYNVLAVLIAVIGIAIIPFLKYLVNSDLEINNLVFYYLIFLLDSVCSYLLANRVAIIQANQNTYIIKKYTTVFVLLKNILQILSLIIFRDFIIYLLIQVIITIVTNIYGAILSKKMYPYAFDNIRLEESDKKSLIENVKSMAIYRLGGAIMNHTDNILISVITGTVKVGILSNYNMIISSINKFTNIFFNSLTASLGNLNAGEEKEKKISMFYNIEFFSNWIFDFCSIALFVLLNEFIGIWIGERYLFDIVTVFAIVLNFYIVGILNPILLYRDTTGLFKQTKYIFLITATINLILSISLGKILGVFGILIASAISRILTNFWYEPYILFKKYFNTSPKKYFCGRIKNILLIIISCMILLQLFRFIDILKSSVWINFTLKVICTGIIPNIILFICYRKKDEFIYFKNLVLKYLKNGGK